MDITSTKDAANNGVKMLVYGQAGAGKTVLCSTAPKPIIISSEAGLLSLKDFDLPAIEITSLEGLQDVYKWVLKSEESKQYETICIDSISEVAEVVLANAKKVFVRNQLQAYGELLERMTLLIKSFRDLKGKHIYMSAKMESQKDEATGVMRFTASMPGSKLSQQIPYFFDEVFRLGIGKNEEGIYRFLQTQPDYQFDAKDRSNALEHLELPNLTHIINKINSKEK